MRMIEGTAATLGAEIQRLHVEPNVPVLAMIADDDDIERARARIRPRIKAVGLGDDDIDALIAEARTGIADR